MIGLSIRCRFALTLLESLSANFIDFKNSKKSKLKTFNIVV